MAVSGDAKVHPMAVVEDGATIGDGAEIGPFCLVGSQVTLDAGVRLLSHVNIDGRTTIGAGTEVGPHSALGGQPQNKSHKGGPTTLVIGKNCIIRESVTMHCGTDDARGETRVGDDCFIMAASHVAHDCIIGNGVTMANAATLGGHCEVGDGVIIGGLTAVHQFVRIGHHAFISGFSGILGDVIPFGMAVGTRAKLRGLNVIGMKRSGMKRSDIVDMRAAVDLLFDDSRPIAENAPIVLEQFSGSSNVAEIVEFVTDRKKRNYTVPLRKGEQAADEPAHG